MSGLIFFNDSQKISNLDKGLAKELTYRGLVSNGKTPKVTFCGMLIRGRDLLVFLPRSIDLSTLSSSEKIHAASELMRAVSLYGEASKTAINMSDSDGDIEGKSQLNLIISLLRFYQKFGLYSRRKSTKGLNTGKPNWKETVTSSVAFPNALGQPVYLDVVSIKSDYFSDCEVARIQAFLLRDIDENFSWILSGKKGRLFPELEEVTQPRGDNQYMLYMLKRELPLLYSDNDIYLIKLLISYLELVSGGSDSNMVVGLKKFHFAWEFMLSRVLTDVWSGINKILPAPAYKNLEGDFENAFRSGMKADIALHRSNDEVVIVDAKYYEASTVNNSPNWSDIVKQFFYEKALLSTNNALSIKNVFIFPGERRHFSAIHLRSKKGGYQFYDEQFPPIHCYYLPPLEVIHYFVNYKKMDNFTDSLFKDNCV